MASSSILLNRLVERSEDKKKKQKKRTKRGGEGNGSKELEMGGPEPVKSGAFPYASTGLKCVNQIGEHAKEGPNVQAGYASRVPLRIVNIEFCFDTSCMLPNESTIQCS
jgi:hypothetical protein